MTVAMTMDFMHIKRATATPMNLLTVMVASPIVPMVALVSKATLAMNLVNLVKCMPNLVNWMPNLVNWMPNLVNWMPNLVV